VFYGSKFFSLTRYDFFSPFYSYRLLGEIHQLIGFLTLLCNAKSFRFKYPSLNIFHCTEMYTGAAPGGALASSNILSCVDFRDRKRSVRLPYSSKVQPNLTGVSLDSRKPYFNRANVHFLTASDFTRVFSHSRRPEA
jgi:hypothetical protein